MYTIVYIMCQQAYKAIFSQAVNFALYNFLFHTTKWWGMDTAFITLFVIQQAVPPCFV